MKEKDVKQAFDLAQKEIEEKKQKEHEKQVAEVKEIVKRTLLEIESLKDKEGDIRLTNVSKLPMHDQNGEFQGAMLILDDVSETQEIHAELQRKTQDLEKLDSRFQDVYTKLKLANEEKTAVDDHFLNLGNTSKNNI